MARVSMRIVAAVFLAVAPEAAVAQHRVGEFWLQGAGVRLEGTVYPYAGPPAGPVATSQTGAGVDAGIAFRLGRFTLGPEGGVYGAAGCTSFRLGGLARWELLEGPWRPYVLGGLDGTEYDLAYTIPSEYGGGKGCGGSFYLSASLGAGLRRMLRRDRVALQLEGRWHPTIQNTGDVTKPRLWVLGLGVAVLW